MIHNYVHELVDDNSFLRLPGFRDGLDVVIKIEGLNLAGSIKLKTAIGLIEEAERDGSLVPGGHIIESSSGNLGIALASVCASTGYRFTCVMDLNAAPHSVALIRALGGEAVIIDHRDANGGFLASRIEYIQERLSRDTSLFWPNQYANPVNPRVHYDRTALPILTALPDVDAVFVGTGTTGTLMGCIRFFRQHAPWVRVVAVDAVGSVTFGFQPGRRKLPGIGTSRVPELCQPSLVDHLTLVDEAEMIAMCRRVARRWGLAVGPSTGAVLAAVERCRDLRPGSTVVAISPDLGEKYLDTVFSDDWVDLNIESPDARATGAVLDANMAGIHA